MFNQIYYYPKYKIPKNIRDISSQVIFYLKEYYLIYAGMKIEDFINIMYKRIQINDMSLIVNLTNLLIEKKIIMTNANKTRITLQTNRYGLSCIQLDKRISVNIWDNFGDILQENFDNKKECVEFIANCLDNYFTSGIVESNPIVNERYATNLVNSYILHGHL